MSFTREEERKIIDVIDRKGTEDFLMTWEDIKEYLNDLLGVEYKSDKTYRQVAKKYEDFHDFESKFIDLEKQRVRVRDANREYKNDIRNQARIDELNDRLIEAIKNQEPIKIDRVNGKKGKSKAIVNASDWHIGANHKNYWGEYSVNIAKERIQHYANEVVKYCNMHDVGEILILNMGDMIEGMIHVSTRIQAEIDAVQQSSVAAELFANFIAFIESNTSADIKVGWVLDNHSRIHANKKDHIEAESFGKLIMELVELRLKMSNSSVKIVGNVIDDNIGYYRLGDKNVVWLHGHLDNPATVEHKLQAGLDFKIDVIVIAHRHHQYTKGKVYQVPSPKGVDDYAKNGRMFDDAAQSFRIYDGNNEITFNVKFD